MLYRAKFICGKGDGKILGLGSYLTAINVHNPSDSKADPDAKPISLEMKVAVALPGGGGKFSDFSGLIDLKADEALEIDCQEILRRDENHCPTTPGSFCKGFVVIRSPAELDVVAVYTVADLNTNQVTTLHTDHVLPNCPIRTESVPAQTVLFVPPKVGGGDADYDGNGPCVDFRLALRLEDGDKTLAAHYRMHAYECASDVGMPKEDFTTAKGEEELILKVASPRGRILGYNVNPTMSQSYIDKNHDEDDFKSSDPASQFHDPDSPVTELKFVGDTDGDEAGTKTRVFITFRDINVELETCAPAESGGVIIQ